MREMTPQVLPLYAVARAAHRVDLILVVGWRPVDDTEAHPVFLILESTSATPATVGFTVHRTRSVGLHTELTTYETVSYYDDRSDAESGYVTAAEPVQTAQYTFAGWLATQTDRTDMVGTLARDIAADIRDNGLQLTTAGDVQRHVQQSGRPAASYDALEAAYQEWAILSCARNPETVELPDGRKITYTWLPHVEKSTP